MIRQIIYDGEHRGFYVVVKTYYGVKYSAFFWSGVDAENWQPQN